MYKTYGAHKTEQGYRFRVYAPNANKVELLTEGNKNRLPLEKVNDTDFEIDILSEGDLSYKYYVDGVEKWDPFATYFENDSKTFNSSYVFNSPRKVEKPSNNSKLVELYLDFIPGENYKDKGFYVAELINRFKYTHIVLMPVNHITDDKTLGYLSNSYFSPYSKYGDPDDFRFLVDKIHEAGATLILDFVLWEFGNDPKGLIDFDGTYLYGTGEAHEFFGGMLFNLESDYVRKFLNSALHFWAKEMKIDGFRIDGVNEILFVNGEIDLNKVNLLKEIISDVDALFILEFITKDTLTSIGLNAYQKEGALLTFTALNYLKTKDKEAKKIIDEVFGIKDPEVVNSLNHDLFMDGFNIIQKMEPKDIEQLAFVIKFIYTIAKPVSVFGHISKLSKELEDDVMSFMAMMDTLFDDFPEKRINGDIYSIKHKDTTLSFNFNDLTISVEKEV